MKIREIRVQNFRNFGPELRSVKFYDEATGLVRPISVLVGSNGCGKTTLLEAVYCLTENVVDNAFPSGPKHLRGLAREAAEAKGHLEFQLELDECAGDEELEEPFWLGVTKQGSKNGRDILWTHALPKDPASRLAWASPGLASEFRQWLTAMLQSDFRGGVLHFPHNRWMEHVQKGAIEAPSGDRHWLHKFSPESKWEGSLSQLWVWQNYLDLEQGREGRPNLAPFVETIEEILGRGRKVKIQNGRVRLERPEFGDSVELHQLPSGEQQILTIFGEIIRMLRPGAVILIDEVEISLHPALQRAVLFHLRRLAAKYDLQVILTTHSMEIVSAVAPEEVINLDDMAVVEQKQAQG